MNEPNASFVHDPELSLPLEPSAAAALARPGAIAGWASEARAALRQLLRRGGRPLTLAGIARDAGVNVRSVYRILYGRQRPSLGTGLALARALGVAPSVLWAYWLHTRALLRENDWQMPRRSRDKRLTSRKGSRYKALLAAGKILT